MTQTTEKPGSAIVPAHQYAIVKNSSRIKELLQENVGSGGLSPFDLDRVKMPSGGSTTWEIPSVSGAQESKELTGIIAAWGDKRSYWEKDMDDSDGNSPPDCSSDDGILGVGTPGGDCSTCPLAQWGSGRNGGQGCKAMKFVFMVSPERSLPMLLAVPPSSLGVIKKYGYGLASESHRYNEVVTRFTLEKTKNKGGKDYSRLIATKVDDVPEEAIPYVEEYSAALKPMVGRIAVNRRDVDEAPF